MTAKSFDADAFVRTAVQKAGGILVSKKEGKLPDEEVWLVVGDLGELYFRKLQFGGRHTSVFTWSRVPIVKDNGFTWWIHTQFDKYEEGMTG